MVDLIDTIVYAGRIKDKSALMSSSSVVRIAPWMVGKKR